MNRRDFMKAAAAAAAACAVPAVAQDLKVEPESAKIDGVAVVPGDKLVVIPENYPLRVDDAFCGLTANLYAGAYQIFCIHGLKFNYNQTVSKRPDGTHYGREASFVLTADHAWATDSLVRRLILDGKMPDQMVLVFDIGEERHVYGLSGVKVVEHKYETIDTDVCGRLRAGGFLKLTGEKMEIVELLNVNDLQIGEPNEQT